MKSVFSALYSNIGFHEERILSTLDKWVIICLDNNFHEERILSILVKWVIICLDINFHEERILNILVKGNRLLLLIKSCLAVKIQFS
ncbi:uncharacterized protein OCT59_006082 [Rhizophagus irregularis]|uniref:uncharacterized protein n=1 Tax=Rhizophagus irregularis TaxID=588596 RepID=UPI00332D4D0E|nr:hypothetical protein OCT59_006082 [Rhizophagus irregularis]